MKQKLVLIVSLLIGVMAFWMTNRYLQSEREKLYAGAEKIEVVAAAADLAPGTVLTVDDLGVRQVYKTAVGGQAVLREDVETIIGKKLRYSMRKNDPMLWSYVDMPERGRFGLAPMINTGMRAISLGIAGVNAVSGLVQPNDRVDILGSFVFPSRKNVETGQMETVTLTLLQDVSVLATGTRLARGAGSMPQNEFEARTTGYNSVTLEVTPREAELLVFAQGMKGQLTLSLRHPEDVGFEADLPEVDFDHLEQKLKEYNLIRQRDIRHKRGL